MYGPMTRAPVGIVVVGGGHIYALNGKYQCEAQEAYSGAARVRHEDSRKTVGADTDHVGSHVALRILKAAGIRVQLHEP
jgi:hypothetical protein